MLDAKSLGVIKKRNKQILLEDTEISSQLLTCLKKSGFRTLGDVSRRTEKEILEVRGVGTRYCNELKNLLGSYHMGFSWRSWRGRSWGA